MKKYSIFALALVLTATLFTGCRNRNNKPGSTSTPTQMPTVEMPTIATTEAHTEATTMPVPDTNATTEPDGDMHGTTDATGTTDGTNGDDMARSRSRRVPGAY